MKKLALIALLLIAGIIVTAFFLIPPQLTVSQAVFAKTNENGVYRSITDERFRNAWYPKLPEGQTMEIIKKMYYAAEVNIVFRGEKHFSKVAIFPLATDLIGVSIETSLSTGNNPFSKLIGYLNAFRLKNHLKGILSALKTFSENKHNLYKYNIGYTTLRDTLLISTRANFTREPTTAEVYVLVNKLKQYLAHHRVKAVNHPILNVTRHDSTDYVAMVAIAIDQKLPETKEFVLKRMVSYKNKIVVAEVKGGKEEIKNAYKELHTFMNDYRLVSPVIHFEYLITDRIKEKDSARWVTRIYFPIV